MDSKDLQQWSAVAAGVALAAAGAKKGGRNGMLLSLAGGARAVASFLKVADTKTRSVFDQPEAGRWRIPRDRLMEDAKAFGRAGRRGKDLVHEASEESFPASDAPSWTPTTGNTGPCGTTGRMH